MTAARVLCFCGLFIGASATFAADIPDYPFVFVVGRADVDTPPDIARCTLTLRSIEQDPMKAESTINGRLKSLLEALSARHVSANDIESFNINKQILTNDSNDKGPAVIRGYDVSRRLKFTSHQLDGLPAIENSMVGAPNIENIDCQFDRSDRDVIEAGLLTKALQSARAEADKLAQPLGRHVTAAVAVSQLPFDAIAGSLMSGRSGSAMMFRKAVSADELLIPSSISMSATVNVLFKME